MIRPNIEARGVRTRQVAGWSSLALGLAGAAWVVAAGLSPWWTLVLLPIFLSAGLGLFQARYRTCVAFVARGVCDIGHGIEKVKDAESLRAMRAQARRVWLLASLFSLVMTLLIMLLKWLLP